MPTAIEPFVEQLQAAGLMTADEARAWYYRLPPGQRPADGATMAAMLVQAGKLCQFQADELLAGRGKALRLGDYTLEERLGIGAMGQVYRARHRKMNRVVALKVLQPTLARSPDMISRFHREVQAAARLIHPHIVAALDASEHDGQHFLVMEYVEGRDLADVVRHDGALGLHRAIDYVLQAARGLEHAHAEGIVHRDIKPGNLLLDKRGVVKILDLGAARMENVWGEPIAENDEGLTHTGNILGTVDYMAPEQALNLRHADGRADIYGLGCTLYRLLTNQRIYPGETVLERILAHRENPIPRLRDFRPDYPEALDTLFQRMVAKRADDRHASMSDLIHELEQLQAQLPPEVVLSAVPNDDESTQSVVLETAETVWSDSPLPMSVQDEHSEPVPVSTNAEPSLTALVEPTISNRAEELAVATVTATSQAPSATLPQPNWIWPVLASLVVLPFVLIALLPSSQAVTTARNSELDELNKRERFVADPQFSERALERMRREFETFVAAWNHSEAEWRTAIEQEIARAEKEGGFRVVVTPEKGSELVSGGALDLRH
jgi:serine/threonine protein kinase